jgi:steroid delta-isomerase-like uncharacterized protein
MHALLSYEEAIPHVAKGGNFHAPQPANSNGTTEMMIDAIDLIRRYYAAFNNGDMTIFLSLLTDDVTHDINQGTSETGKAAFGIFMDRMNRHYRERIEDIVVMATEDGTRAAAEFYVHGEYLSTDEGLPPADGQTYRLPAGAFFEIRDNKVARVTNYYNLQDWIKQVGG